jgi:glycosylphosphatidylinositol transamidase (GPIT) subunit GPI8
MNFIITFACCLLLVFGKKNPELDLEYKDNFYILLSSSKFYFNYRHSSNVLIFYKYLKDRGITDDRILLMLPENHACNARNPMKG